MAAFNDNTGNDNILKSLMEFLTPERMERLSSVTGISAGKLQSALKTLAPALVAGIARFGSSGTGASRVMDFINRFDLDSVGQVKLFEQAVDPAPPQTDLKSSSESFLSVALGGGAGELLERVASYLGTGTESLKKLAGAVVPLIMGFIGKKVRAEGGSVAWLSDYLNEQERIAHDKLPAGILGFAATAEEVPFSTAPSAMRETSDRGFGAWWVPLVAVAALIIGGIWLYNRDAGEGERMGATDTSGTGVTDGVAMMSAGNIRLREILGEMQPGQAPQVVTFQEITFVTGTADLEPAAVQVVEDLAAAVKENPGVRLRLEGHTDATGAPEVNEELSLRRAVAVKQRIVANGVAEERVEAVGKGAEVPVAPNETEEGRAQNRRVTVVVIHAASDEGIAH